MRRRGSLGTVGMLLLVVAAGCEDLPTPTVPIIPVASASPTPTPTPKPSTSGSPGDLLGSPLPTATPSLGGAITLVPTTQATATPTPTPRIVTAAVATATPRPVVTAATPAPTPDPLNAASLKFDSPTDLTDFSKPTTKIELRATLPVAIKIKEMALFYEGQEIMRQKSDARVIVLSTWNPHVANSVNNQDKTPVPFGHRTLVGQATTVAGVVSETEFTFEKPFQFRGWRRDVIKDGVALTLPGLPSARTQVGMVGMQSRVFAFFGDAFDQKVVPELRMLHLDVFNPSWDQRVYSPVIPIRHAAIANKGDWVYQVGGLASSVLASDAVTAYDPFTAKAAVVPHLPIPLSDAAAAVLDHYLYVVGGTISLTPPDEGAVDTVYRLELNNDGSPAGKPWEVLPPLPEGDTRRAGSLVAYGDTLYLFGGVNRAGLRSEQVLRYEPNGEEWTREGLIPRGVSHASAVALGGKIWLFGGNIADVAVTADSVEFDPLTGSVRTFQSDLNLPTPRSGMGSAVVNGQLYLVGGHSYNIDGVAVPIDSVIRADTL